MCKIRNRRGHTCAILMHRDRLCSTHIHRGHTCTLLTHKGPLWWITTHKGLTCIILTHKQPPWTILTPRDPTWTIPSHRGPCRVTTQKGSTCAANSHLEIVCQPNRAQMECMLNQGHRHTCHHWAVNQREIIWCPLATSLALHNSTITGTWTTLQPQLCLQDTHTIYQIISMPDFPSLFLWGTTEWERLASACSSLEIYERFSEWVQWTGCGSASSICDQEDRESWTAMPSTFGPSKFFSDWNYSCVMDFCMV